MQDPELDSMAITKAEWRQIEEMVENATKPRGWQKLATWLRNWGIAGIVVAILLSLTSISIVLGIAAFSRMEANARFQQHTEDRLGYIETNLSALRLSQAAMNPNDPSSQDEVRDVLTTARQKSIRLPSAVLEQAGLRFVGAAKVEPKGVWSAVAEPRGAWSAALDCAEYRSFLNEVLYTVDKDARLLDQSSEGTMFRFDFADDAKKIVITMAGGAVPPDRAAIYEQIGSEHTVPLSPARLIVTGPGTAHLDRHRIRNVVFRGIRIVYDGGPLILDNVYFIDCTFDAPPSQQGRAFAVTVITSAPISLTVKS